MQTFLGLVRISRNMKSTISKTEGVLDGTWAYYSSSSLKIKLETLQIINWQVSDFFSHDS